VHGDPETLYDAHAPRLYSYCWSLVGDEAPEALKDTFMAAARLGPPRGDEVLWLYALARSACMRRGALDRVHCDAHDADPLRRAAAGLRADHREVLLLSAGVWLEAPDIARLIGLAPDTVRQLIQAARSRLERAVLDTLLHRPIVARQDELIAAFERGRLPMLLARRVPAEPPAALRADVLAAAERALPATTGPLPVTTPGTSPLIVVDPRHARKSDGTARRRVKGAAELGAIAACAAAAAGLIVAWGSPNGKSGGGSLSAPVPHVDDGSGNPQAPSGTTPGGPDAAPVAPTATPFTTEVTDVPSDRPAGPGTDAGAPSAPSTGGGATDPSGPGQGEQVEPPPSSPSTPSSPKPSKPSLGGTVGDTVDTVGDTVGGVIGGVGGLVGGVTGSSQAGDTVGGVGDTVGGTVDTVGGAVGGLLP
jgi:DNA-directed RNA polymerase specialized sigma24 family protein